MYTGLYHLGLLFVGGGVGTLLRFGVVRWVHTAGPGGFPYGTLAVNIIGCFAIGALWHTLATTWAVREEVRLALLVGLIGGFTTFSTFGLETIQLWSDGHQARAIVYVLASNIFGLAAVLAGLSLFPGVKEHAT
ncbi:MAG: fluoride efflux transporter CrcB [Phycisphaeraceae bacterium]|nr:fluoride efflux transporter CrcB [Phycisphaeraceae bacterium]MCW5763588.1 fluoride efflux transporter CrcB [Phycisphaeraceae bacterium]